ncbi:MAG TPA: hypothetical protein ENJ18_17495 [Nannocystis exedens]|nr:hypothetical protein [Nannocystis exedens]
MLGKRLVAPLDLRAIAAWTGHGTPELIGHLHLQHAAKVLGHVGPRDGQADHLHAVVLHVETSPSTWAGR